jgi:hypothetical protein
MLQELRCSQNSHDSVRILSTTLRCHPVCARKFLLYLFLAHCFIVPTAEPHGRIRYKCNYFVPSILFLSYLIHNSISPGRGEWNNHYHYLIDRAAFGSLFPEQTSWFVTMRGDWFFVRARSEMMWTKLTTNLFPPAMAAEGPSSLALKHYLSHCRAHSVFLEIEF